MKKPKIFTVILSFCILLFLSELIFTLLLDFNLLLGISSIITLGITSLLISYRIFSLKQKNITLSDTPKVIELPPVSTPLLPTPTESNIIATLPIQPQQEKNDLKNIINADILAINSSLAPNDNTLNTNPSITYSTNTSNTNPSIIHSTNTSNSTPLLFPNVNTKNFNQVPMSNNANPTVPFIENTETSPNKTSKKYLPQNLYNDTNNEKKTLRRNKLLYIAKNTQSPRQHH